MRGLIRKDWNTDVDYNPPRCFYDGVEGRLQSAADLAGVLKQVRVARGMAYINPSDKAEKP